MAFRWIFLKQLGTNFRSCLWSSRLRETSFQFGLHFRLAISTFSSTFAIDHFELFGLRQGLHMGEMLEMPSSDSFVTRFHYNLVRHPIMTGFFIMFWSCPVMTQGRCYFFDLTTIENCFFSHWRSFLTGRQVLVSISYHVDASPFPPAG